MKNINLIGNISSPNLNREEKLALAKQFKEDGLDELIYMGEGTYEDFVDEIKYLADSIDLPLNVYIKATKFDDVKYTLYAGAARVAIYDPVGKNRLPDVELVNESSLRFGSDKIYINVGFTPDNIIETNDLKEYKLFGVGGVYIREYDMTKFEELKQFMAETDLPIGIDVTDIPLEHIESLVSSGIDALIVGPLSTSEYLSELKDIIKSDKKDISVMSFSEFKLNSDNLIPVIVQDYRTDEVLMMAYMNEEAYNKTIETGTMTYFSRSRQSLWVKGETSGHFQYVQQIAVDCDKDTLLARVKQIGAACHTGNPTCFYTDIIKKDYDAVNPLKVFQEEYNIILDRKNNPKEGSYTNYLFDKGIDKILKKVGEEATEIVIAAKNPDKEELKYEIADFLYHAMVLMVNQEVTWDEVVEAIAKRR